MPMILVIILITVLANLADLLLKIGANRAGESLGDPLAVFLTPWIWMGALLGIGAMGLWVYILGRHHISHAYPIFVGLGFLNITLASWLFLDEAISSRRLAGTGLILAGIVVVHLQSRETGTGITQTGSDTMPAEPAEKTSR
ncbi:MAG: hypothetical protein HZB44_09170 [Actinobacteria bacterium]|nr:hypothetical protein [Actinomycetota bacterium]